MRDVSSVSWILSDYPEPLFVVHFNRGENISNEIIKSFFSQCIESFFGVEHGMKIVMRTYREGEKRGNSTISPCMIMWVDPPHTFAVCALKISITLKIIFLIAQLFSSAFPSSICHALKHRRNSSFMASTRHARIYHYEFTFRSRPSSQFISKKKTFSWCFFIKLKKPFEDPPSCWCMSS